MSRRETTYFDATGKAAYRKTRLDSDTVIVLQYGRVMHMYIHIQCRQRTKSSFMKRVKMVRLFFVNYSKWYNLNENTGSQTGGRRRRTKHSSHVV